MKTTLSILLLASSVYTTAQVGVINSQFQGKYAPGLNVWEIPPPKPGLKGSPYLFEDWRVGELWLKKSVIKDIPIKYDLIRRYALIKTEEDIRMASFHFIEKFKTC